MRNSNIFGDVLECIGGGFEIFGGLFQVLIGLFWLILIVIFAPFYLFWIIVKGLCDIA